jgi:hypothetical protein
MNRIILIGNGFDLAHGLKTSYSDFIDDFWTQEKDKVIANLCADKNGIHYYKDDFLVIESPRPFKGIKNFDVDKEGLAFFDEISNTRFSAHLFSGNVSLSIQYYNNFLMEITRKKSLKNWVDIEIEYYNALLDCINSRRKYGIEKLNNDFSFIVDALKNYLVRESKNNFSLIDQIYNNIYSPISDKDFIEKPGNTNIENIFFLVFNYTHIIQSYAKDKSIDFAYIHGELQNANNPIVFGYGDEVDENYSQIERTGNNDYLKNIKSFKYFNSDIYKNFVRFINSGCYQVFVMGHSCGISDRTLLHTLFEHDNCKSIKVFYHKKDDTDNYNDVVMNISRNFSLNKKERMREIVVSKNNCVTLV